MPYELLDVLLDIVLSPALWLGIALAALYSLLFSALRGGGWRMVPRDLLDGLIGFGLGQFISAQLGLNLLRIGELRLLGGTLGAGLGLLAGRLIWRRFAPPASGSVVKGRTSG